MKETGIIMTETSPVATRERRKTTTRRVIKPDWWRCLDPEDSANRVQAVGMCPYGGPGDRLYVKEAWQVAHDHVAPAYAVRYVADGAVRAGLGDVFGKVRSPMFMPRWAARTLLEVTAVRIERLQEVTPESAIAEGVVVQPHDKENYQQIALATYRELWNKINGRRGFGWDTNPWVFVIDYKVIEGLVSSEFTPV